MGRVRVVLADDHDSYREGLARAIRGDPELDLVAEVADGAQALDAIVAECPDVAILDVRMPRVDGLEACERASRLDPHPGTRVVLITDEPNIALWARAAEAGAAALLDKSASRVEICARLKDIANDVV